LSEAHLLEPLVRRWSRRLPLSADDRSAILALPATKKSFGRDAYMVREGARTTECNLLLRGFAYRQKLLSDGERQIISIHIPTSSSIFRTASSGPPTTMCKASTIARWPRCRGRR
jgi:hypothetical protein